MAVRLVVTPTFHYFRYKLKNGRIRYRVYLCNPACFSRREGKAGPESAFTSLNRKISSITDVQEVGLSTAHTASRLKELWIQPMSGFEWADQCVAAARKPR